ncbi:MAG: 16S rRNA (adenine(1518)-N(6)/adenine(1519)-N(6))-dimethyltransferase RsmA, partial [Spirochaetaceae bacterium]|nr:16S rRNA (adenine(1518)-N(6)/adenine(1519)-N(6))-dimethyltransferase RsmA [Spirochaetaceae bacterium]
MKTPSPIAYDSPAKIRQFLESENLAMSKRFGQNFLIDRNVRERLYRSLDLDNSALIWEIGPGLGSMTEILLEKGNRVTAFEIDYGFVRILRGIYAGSQDFELVEGDFLKTWNAYAVSKSGTAEIRKAMPDRIFGNLPYSAALAIIADLLENDFVPAKMLFTVQKEAAQRIAAKPGSKDYSAFSVLCSSVCSIQVLYDIGASAFWPQPRVTSSVVSLAPRADPVASRDRKGFSRFVRSAFASRR